MLGLHDRHFGSYVLSVAAEPKQNCRKGPRLRFALIAAVLLAGQYGTAQSEDKPLTMQTMIKETYENWDLNMCESIPETGSAFQNTCPSSPAYCGGDLFKIDFSDSSFECVVSGGSILECTGWRKRDTQIPLKVTSAELVGCVATINIGFAGEGPLRWDGSPDRSALSSVHYRFDLRGLSPNDIDFSRGFPTRRNEIVHRVSLKPKEITMTISKGGRKGQVPEMPNPRCEMMMGGSFSFIIFERALQDSLAAFKGFVEECR